MNDLKFAFRQLLKNPGFTAVAVVTLALGIGANTSMFSVLNLLLFRPLPYPEPDRLVRIYRTSPYSQEGWNSPGDFLDYREQNRVFEHLAAFSGTGRNLSEPGHTPERLEGIDVTANLFAALGVQPVLGRVFTAEEEQPDANVVALLGHGFWKRHFGGETNIIGRTLRFDGENVTVIGVMPAPSDGHSLLGSEDICFPLRFTAEQRRDRSDHSRGVVARLKPGVSQAQAQAEMTALATRLAKEHPETNALAGVRVLALAKSFEPDSSRQGLWFLFGLSSFVLLIACANLANLQLARTARRSRELAVRAALGAGRARLMRQLLTESLLISLLGGVLGLMLASWCDEFLGRRLGWKIPLDLRVIGFALLCCVATVALSGTTPAWLAVSADVNDKLKESSRGATSSRSHHRLQHALIVGEVALALVLLSGAGATLRSLQRFVRLDPGWRVDGLLTAQLNLASYGEPEKRPLFFEELERRLAALPGVQSAGISSSSPVWSNGGGRYLAIEGRPAPAPGEAPLAACASVSPAYFATLGIRLRQGRTFSSADTGNRPAVVVINESLARQFWPGENPIGKRVGGTDPAKPDWAEVVGVVNDAGNPTNPFKPDTRLQLYEPLAQKPEWGFTIVLRTTAVPASIAPALRRTVAELDADLPVYWIQSVRQIIARGMAGSYHLAGLLGVSGILGLVLAAVGIYGVTSYSMAQRTGELGIRMALGAQKLDMLWLVLRQGLRLGLFGVVLGFGGSFAMMRILGALTPSDSPARDPVTMAGVPVSGWVVTVIAAVVLLAVTLLACYFPARRAARINPIEALRYE